VLDGRLVLDLTRHLPGPYATQLLADFGARVVKVEPPGGDPVRFYPPHDAAGVAAGFRALNGGKESVVLDLKAPAAVDALRRLAARADVLVEGFRPGVLARLGLEPAAARAANPGLVWCSISGYGQDGPYRDRPGHDLNYQAYSGALGLNVGPDGRVATPGLQAGDLSASLAAVVGILLALLERERTGRGRDVDASMLDALVSIQALTLGNHLGGDPAVPGRLLLAGGLPSYGVYRARDGRHVALGILEPKFWRVFCEVVDRPAWLERQLDDALRPELEALFASRTRDEWRVILENSGCCAAPVLDYDEVLADDQVRARGLVGEARPAPPVRFRPPVAARPDAPFPTRPGEHTRAVLAELTDLDPAALEALLASGAARQAT